MSAEAVVTLKHFNQLLTLIQDCAEPIIAAGEEHAPFVLAARVVDDKLCNVIPAMVPNRSKADLVASREVINALLTARVIDLGAFVCESWVACFTPEEAALRDQNKSLEGCGRETSAVLVMLYSRDEEHCVTNPITEGPPRKMARGRIETVARFEGRLSLHSDRSSVRAPK